MYREFRNDSNNDFSRMNDREFMEEPSFDFSPMMGSARSSFEPIAELDNGESPAQSPNDGEVVAGTNDSSLIFEHNETVHDSDELSSPTDNEDPEDSHRSLAYDDEMGNYILFVILL